jgi:hypothetical protein
MSKNELARRALEEIQHAAYVQVGMEIPQTASDELQSDGRSIASYPKYLEKNPDYTPEEREAHARASQEQSSMERIASRTDLGVLSGRSGLILANRVDELKAACHRLEPAWDLERIYFGTIPGGGLDAYTRRVAKVDQYAVVIPDGFFYLTNLVTRLVILLQPIVATREGPLYRPSASFDQLTLMHHPYVEFRASDLLRAYFLHGEPTVAMPYRQALPFQDRFVYLLTGTELYVLAHEVAHVLLGHIESERTQPVTSDEELEADSLALRIVSEHFDAIDEHSVARAGLCGSMFHYLVRLWEGVVKDAVGEQHELIRLGEHPPAKDRLPNFISDLLGQRSGTTPNWYPHVFNGVRIAMDLLPERLMPQLLTEASTLGGLHGRVLPASLAHLGRFSTPLDYEPSRTIAHLIVSPDRNEHLLGLWFALDNDPMFALTLYQGVVDDDDDDWRELSRAALVSIEPLYEDYLPRLLERFRETDQRDELEQYIGQISMFVAMGAEEQLGENRVEGGPMSPSFFDSAADE